MRFTGATALAMASTVSGHALMYGVWVNGEDQGDGQDLYIRTPPNNSPVVDVTSPEIVCGPNGANEAPSFVSAAAGDTLSFEWYHNNRDDDIIDGSHLGPIITYIAEYTSGAATGPIWTKIAEDGFDGTQWAVDKIKANNGLNDFVLPPDLAAGQYLIRQEILAHHESNRVGGAQFYPSCVQVEVTSGGSAVPDQAFDFNTGYTSADPGIHFDLYNFNGDYEIPGPEVWTGQGGGSSPAPAPAPAPEEPTSAVPAPQPTGAPEPDLSTIAPAPTSTFATVTTPPVDTPTTPTEAPAPPTECRRRRRSLKNKKAKKAKRSTSRIARRAL